MPRPDARLELLVAHSGAGPVFVELSDKDTGDAVTVAECPTAQEAYTRAIKELRAQVARLERLQEAARG